MTGLYCHDLACATQFPVTVALVCKAEMAYQFSDIWNISVSDRIPSLENLYVIMIRYHGKNIDIELGSTENTRFGRSPGKSCHDP